MTEPDPLEGAPEEPVTRSEFNRLVAAVKQLIPTSRAEAQEHTERRLERPTTIMEQVHSEFDRRDRESAAKKESEENRKHREATEARFKKLEEKAPEPAPRAIEGLMGWRRR